MPYDYKNELKKVKEYYKGDPLQKRFSAIMSGETNSGKTFIFRTARIPVHIDSFDPGGTKCLLYDPNDSTFDKYHSLRTEENPEGQIIADTRYEREDPFEPTVWAEWKKITEIRFKIGYYDRFATYGLDGLSKFSDAVMNDLMNASGRAGETPRHRKDYNPQKVQVVNYISKLMNLPCDFILTAHLREIKKLIHLDTKTGVAREEVKYRLKMTGQAVVTIPILFDEIYVLLGKGMPPKRKLVTDSLGEYVARSRLKGKKRLDTEEEPDIKALLKKAKIPWEDKPKLEID